MSRATIRNWLSVHSNSFVPMAISSSGVYGIISYARSARRPSASTGIADDGRLLAGPDADEVHAQRVGVRDERLVEPAVRLARPPGEQRIVAVVERVPVGDARRGARRPGRPRATRRRASRRRERSRHRPGAPRLVSACVRPATCRATSLSVVGRRARVHAFAIEAIFLQHAKPIEERQQRRHLRPARVGQRQHLDVVLDAVAEQDVVDLAFGVERR